jgi:hypothetical protein
MAHVPRQRPQKSNTVAVEDFRPETARQQVPSPSGVTSHGGSAMEILGA